MTDVVAALIWGGCRFLACQRPAHKKRGLLWEFVGGKTEPGETLEEALIRECREELDVIIEPEHIFMQVIHQYPDITIRLSLFNATIKEGQLKLLEHNAIEWMTTDNLDPSMFCPADKDILAVLKNIHNHLEAELYALKDESYRKFMLSLMPGYPEEKYMGVRMPILRKMAKKIYLDDLGSLPHAFFEENCIHGLLINSQSSFSRTIEFLDEFLPCVDNWAVCDLLSPICFKDPPKELINHIQIWLSSDHPYTVRFAINMLRKFYLGDNFSGEYMDMVASLHSEHYYINMMIAWYFATALDKQYDCAYEIIKACRLDPWVHNKTIQKACESFCIPQDRKTALRTLKKYQEVI